MIFRASRHFQAVADVQFIIYEKHGSQQLTLSSEIP